jgi:hypothetical protein
MTQSSCCLWNLWQKCRMRIFVQLFAWNFEQIVAYLSTPIVRSWWSQWGLRAASHCRHVEGNGLMPCEWHSQGYDCTYSCCVCFTRTDITITFIVWFWSFLCNVLDARVCYVIRKSL